MAYVNCMENFPVICIGSQWFRKYEPTVSVDRGTKNDVFNSSRRKKATFLSSSSCTLRITHFVSFSLAFCSISDGLISRRRVLRCAANRIKIYQRSYRRCEKRARIKCRQPHRDAWNDRDQRRKSLCEVNETRSM